MADTKKYVSLTRLSNFLDNIKAKYSQIGHKHIISDLTDYVVDSELSSESTNPVQNRVVDAEFDSVATAMAALEDAIDSNAETLSSLVGDTSVSEQITSIIDPTLSVDGAAADAKVVGDEISTLKSKIFIDTYANYETAYANGEISNGTLVIIVEDDVDIGDIDGTGGSSPSASTSSLLGTGVLGYMILG